MATARRCASAPSKVVWGATSTSRRCEDSPRPSDASPSSTPFGWFESSRAPSRRKKSASKYDASIATNAATIDSASRLCLSSAASAASATAARSAGNRRSASPRRSPSRPSVEDATIPTALGDLPTSLSRNAPTDPRIGDDDDDGFPTADDASEGLEIPPRDDRSTARSTMFWSTRSTARTHCATGSCSASSPSSMSRRMPISGATRWGWYPSDASITALTFLGL